MNSILVPIRFLLQARDDIHLLATSSRRLAETADKLVDFEVDLLERLGRLDDTTRATVARLETIDRAVERLNTSSGTLAAAVEPLQGISERIARIAERLPEVAPRASLAGASAATRPTWRNRSPNRPQG